VRTVTASSTAKAVDAFAANWAKMHKSGATQGPLLNSISNAASKLGAACESYASSIDNLRHTLEGLAIAAGVVAGVGIGLTIFTLGFSDAAAAGGEAAIAAEASAAALAMTTEIEGSAELAVLAEAEEVVNTAAAGLSPVNAAALTTVAAGSVALAGASSAMAAPVPPPSFPVTPGPLPRDPLSAFPALSPAQQRAVRTWMAQMAADGRTTPASGASGKP
jgi:hypothetical protein